VRAFDVLAGPRHLVELVNHRVAEGSLAQIEDLSGGRGTEEESDRASTATDPLAGGFARLRDYLAMVEAFIFPTCRQPLALLLRCGAEISDPSAPTQWRLAVANAAGEAARASARSWRTSFRSSLGECAARDSSARPRGLASIAPCSIGWRPLGPGRTSVKGSRLQPITANEGLATATGVASVSAHKPLGVHEAW